MAGDGSTFVKWCGLLINTQNLELQADYTRYAGLPLATTLTVPLFKVTLQLLTFAFSPIEGCLDRANCCINSSTGYV